MMKVENIKKSLVEIDQNFGDQVEESFTDDGELSGLENELALQDDDFATGTLDLFLC
ncbi:MAG: hypothetical protein DHS20C16_17250 [Phycisphaerae bacterium]|nr:MAG: hypothetical protein DHS20C16_17250 [Phycisphaerae bacterium]